MLRSQLPVCTSWQSFYPVLCCYYGRSFALSCCTAPNVLAAIKLVARAGHHNAHPPHDLDLVNTAATAGDIIGCLINLEEGEISFSRNGCHMGTAFTGASCCVPVMDPNKRLGQGV